MKRMLLAALAVVLLAGCNATPIATTPITTSPTASIIDITSPSPNPTIMPLPSTPAKTQTPAATTKNSFAEITNSFPPIIGKEIGPTYDIGNIVVSKGDLVYFVEDESYDRDNTLVSKNVIYWLEQSGKKSKITSVEEQTITSLFLDGNNTLYFVAWGIKYNTITYSLYQHRKTGNLLIADSIEYIIRVDDRNIYYLKSDGSLNKYDYRGKNTITVATLNESSRYGLYACGSFIIWSIWLDHTRTTSQYYAIDLVSGIKYTLFNNKDKLLTVDDRYAILYSSELSLLKIYDFVNRAYYTCPSPITVQQEYGYNVICIDGFIYFFDSVGDQTYIYKISLEDGALIKKVVYPFSIYCDEYYKGNLYLYTGISNGYNGEAVSVREQAIQKLDLESLKFVTLYKIDREYSAYFSSRTFTIAGNDIWMIDWADNTDDCFYWGKYILK